MKRHGLVTLIFLMSACARPEYVDNTDINIPQSQTEQEDSCPLAFPNEKICASMHWLKAPTSSDFSEFELHFSDEVTPSSLSVILWMPSMGHGSSPVKIEPLGDGKFRIHRVYFIMPGDWEVRVYLKNGPTILDQIFVPLMVP